MFNNFLKNKRQLLIATVLLLFGACKQSEFYDKSQLLNASSTPSAVDTGGGIIVPPIVTPPIVTVPGIILYDRKELFTQSIFKDGDVDILWMIDNSGSMANKQKRLSESLGIFIDKFLDKNINFRMAITTTDGTNLFNGKMIGDANKLTSSYLTEVGKANFMAYFQAIVKVGTNGSGIEQGLKTSTTFFDRYAASFLRTDANLAIVEISDEEDQSDKAVGVYLDKLYALKSSKGKVKVYSVVTKTLPDDHTLSDSIGNRYILASQTTGATSSEIKNDFSTILLDIGNSIVSLVDSFALAEAPYNNVVKVFVNKTEVLSGWTFDIATHSIKFNSNSIPVEGATIEINYQVKASVLGAN